MVYPNDFWKPGKKIAQLDFGEDSLWLRFLFRAHKSEISNRWDTALPWFTHLASTLSHTWGDAGMRETQEGGRRSFVHQSRWGLWVCSSGKMSSFNSAISAFPSCAVTQFSLWSTETSGDGWWFSSPFTLPLPSSTCCPPHPAPSPPHGPQRESSSRHAGLTHHEARPPLLITEHSLFLSCLFLAWRTKTERGVLIFLVSLLQLAALPISNISCDVTVIFF